MWAAAFKGHADVVALLQEAGAESVGRARLRVAVILMLLSPFLLAATASAPQGRGGRGESEESV